ncbi:hypothetical protein HYT25_02300 [Candidatus Pacearchaeota archaeon]|nr:hypothetical protein [Candidatus Pacearchaeota archaeon]
MGNKLTEVYLKCDLGKGMFSNERSFSFENYRGEIIEGFYPLPLINQDRIKVSLLKEEDNLVYICLHQPPVIEKGGEIQIVKREQIIN